MLSVKQQQGKSCNLAFSRLENPACIRNCGLKSDPSSTYPLFMASASCLFMFWTFSSMACFSAFKALWSSRSFLNVKFRDNMRILGLDLICVLPDFGLQLAQLPAFVGEDWRTQDWGLDQWCYGCAVVLYKSCRFTNPTLMEFST